MLCVICKTNDLMEDGCFNCKGMRECIECCGCLGDDLMPICKCGFELGSGDWFDCDSTADDHIGTEGCAMTRCPRCGLKERDCGNTD